MALTKVSLDQVFRFGRVLGQTCTDREKCAEVAQRFLLEVLGGGGLGVGFSAATH